MDDASDTESCIAVWVGLTLEVGRHSVHVGWHPAVPTVWVAIHGRGYGLLGRHLELKNELLVAVHIPWHHNLSRLTEDRHALRPDEEVVCQVNLLAGASLVNNERSVVTSHIHVSQTKLD